MPSYRKEKDLIGEKEIPFDALYGIHTERAIENFNISGRPVHPELIHAYGSVKLACARTNQELHPWKEKIFIAIEGACIELSEGKLDKHIPVDSLQGGAGTSTNMNVNEVIANRSLQILGRNPGDYETVHPIDDINRHQSTNDTYPTALRIAAIRGINVLEKEIVALIEEFQRKEKETSNIVKVGRTEMQDAVLISLGREMSAYAEALGRDRWRIYKCIERLRVVNLGGTAIGTGILAPRLYIFRVVDVLREITGLNIARAENLVDATQNTDAFAEVSGMLKTCAVNLLKIAGDLRFLSSGPHTGIGEVHLQPRQAGSSLMPGKVNPVIPEAVIQVCLTISANDHCITSACSMGNLELNAFMPLIAEKLLDSIKLLTRICRIFRMYCVSGIKADEKQCKEYVENTTACLSAILNKIGYDSAQQIALKSLETGQTVREIILNDGILTEQQFEALISPANVMKLGSDSKGSKDAKRS